MLLSEHTNSKKQGDAGLGTAIGYFCENGYTVSVPLTDSQDYDLVVDIDGLQRVQVKTTTCKTKYNIYVLDLRTSGGNQSRSINKLLNKNNIEYVFALTEEKTKYLIPVKDLDGVSCINLGKKYKKFII